MNTRTGTNAAVSALLLGVALVIAIGFGVDELRQAVIATAQTAQINDGAAEIARGPARVVPIGDARAAVADTTGAAMDR